MSKMKIKGKVVYQNIEGGLWGIEDAKGNQYRPVNMPAALQEKGKNVEIVAKEVDEMSVFMWGIPIKIVSFE